jgi:acetyl esterase/lipase
VIAVLALLLALLVAAIAPWAFVPAPRAWLLPLSVAAPELSVWLLVTACAAILLAMVALRRQTRHRRLAYAAIVVAATGAACPVAVLSQIPAHVREFDRGWQRVFPAPVTTASVRTHVYTWREMFFGLDLHPVTVTRAVPVSSPGGVALTMDVYRPDHDRVLPAVVQIYGGGWRNGAPGDDETLARALAGSGFVVFAIDYRHTPDWRWPAQLDDVLDAIDWVAVNAIHHRADGTRMGLIGRSAGAQLAMRASQDARGANVRAVVTLYGPVDLVEGHRTPPDPDPLDVRRVEEALFGATPDERLDAYVDASPLTRAGRPHPPVMVATAGRDHIVEPRFGRMLHEQLAQSGVSILLHLPWADHAFDRVPFGPSSQISLYYTQQFFTLTLR